jgi:hypothetical protein
MACKVEWSVLSSSGRSCKLTGFVGMLCLPVHNGTVCFWSQVSDDIVVHVLSYAGVREVLRLAIVCKQWSRAARQLVSSIQLCALTPPNFSHIYPKLRVAYFSDPSLAADAGSSLPYTLRLCQGLQALPLLTCVSIFSRFVHITPGTPRYSPRPRGYKFDFN